MADELDRYSERLLEVAYEVAQPWLLGLGNSVCKRQMLAVGPAELEGFCVALATELLHELRQLLATDVEQQRRNPLDVFRSAAVALSEHLSEKGAQPVERDEFLMRAFPTDVLGLAPSTWSEIDETLAEPGLEWGAFKAATIISRRKTAR